MVKFIHTADWQLGKPLSQFEDGLSEQLRQARIEAIDIIARIAKERSIPHVIVAGDVFDQEIPNPKTIRQALEGVQSLKRDLSEVSKAALQLGYGDPFDKEQKAINELLCRTGASDQICLTVWAYYHDVKMNTAVTNKSR